jgi:tetratricopeptide (TPR) repeat protein
LVSILAFSTGCDSYATKKAAAKLRWEKTTAKTKVPAARGLFENGRIDDAEKTLQECLEINPEVAEAHLLMGRIHFVRGNLTQALDSLLLAVKLDNKLDKAWYLLAAVSQQNNQPQKAIEYYSKAMSLKPANVDYITAVAETYAARGQYAEAVTLLETKSKLLPGSVELKVVSADVLNRRGNTEQAIVLYNRALLLKPGDPDITEALAYCYIIDKQWARAAKMFEELVADADNARKTDYLQLLAMCCMNAGDYGKAVTYYDRLSVTRRDDAELWLQMGQAALGAAAPKRTYACADRALALRPAWPDAIALKACAQYLSADYAAAIRTFKKITSNERIGAFAWTMTGRCYQQLGQTVRARRAYEKAAHLNPESELLSLLMKQAERT